MLRLALPVLLAVASAPQQPLLPPRFEAGMRTEMTLRSRHTELHHPPVIRVDGHEVDYQRPDALKVVNDREVVVVDTVERASNGARDEVLRNYTTLSLSVDGVAHESPLEGETLRLTRVKDEERAEGDAPVKAELVSDGPVDEAYLRYHSLDSVARVYLEDLERPPKVGESWELSDEALARELFLLGVFFEADFLGLKYGRWARDHVDVAVTITCRGDEKLDGAPCAVLVAKGLYELEARDVSPHEWGREIPNLGLPEGAEPWIDHAVTGRFTATIWLDPEAGRVLRQDVVEEYDSSSCWRWVTPSSSRVEHDYRRRDEYATTQVWGLLDE